MPETLTLIAGRTAKQGTALNAGKLKDEYREVTSTGEMNVEDMARMGLSDGDRVRVSTAVGETVIRCVGRTSEDLPPGLMFIAYGPPSSQLMGSDTACSGMPISKNLQVEVEPVSDGGGVESA